MNNPSPTEPLSLDQVIDAFTQWRAHRPRQQPTPLALKQLAVALLDHHVAFHVCQALRINGGALKQWAGHQRSAADKASSAAVTSGTHASSFVELPPTESTPAADRSEHLGTETLSGLIIDLPNGARVRFTERVSLATLSVLIQESADTQQKAPCT